MEHADYLSLNRAMWNDRVGVHLESRFYDLPGFMGGRNTLTPIELDLLGDVGWKRLLHLQCHFGQDTLSLARLGAAATGIDLSDRAVATARDLAARLGLSARFIECDVYDLPQHLDETFDVIFTSYGVLGWLPDLERWATVVAHFLRPGGSFVLAEFHPVVWMFDDHLREVAYSYFNKQTIVEEVDGTYTDGGEQLHHTSVSWNHALSEVTGALLRQGLRLEQFEEYDYSPWNCFRNTVENEPGKFQIRGLEGKLPLVYAMRWMKRIE